MPLRYIVPMVLILALQYIFVKDALNYSSPILFQTMVYAIMTVTLSVAGGFRYVFDRRVALFCIPFWLSGVTWILGLNLVSSSESAILSFTMPLFSIPLAVVVLGERTTRAELVGAVVGFSGVVIYNVPLLSGASTTLGAILTLGDGFFWGLFTVYGRKLSARDPVQIAATASLFSLVANLPICFLDVRLVPSVDLFVDLAFQGLLSGVLGVFLWLRLLRLEKTSKVTTLTFVAPVITLGYVAVSTRVIPPYLSLAGVALIFLGIYIANILGRSRAERPPAGSGASPQPGQRAS